MGASGGMNDISFGFDGSKAHAIQGKDQSKDGILASDVSNDHTVQGTPMGTIGKPLKQQMQGISQGDDDDEMDTVTYQFSEATGLQRLDQPSIDSEDHTETEFLA